jgi:hypothetical protein
MKKNGEGWTVIQRRQDGSVDFERTWDEYAAGFGDPAGEHWLGNENLAALTPTAMYTLRITLRDWEGNEAHATYSHFRIDNSQQQYNLTSIGTYSGTAGDSLRDHLWMKFSTYDQDNDQSLDNCAQHWHGGWWFTGKDCFVSKLNGKYDGYLDAPEGIIWSTWKGYFYSLKYTEMKIHGVYVE